MLHKHSEKSKKMKYVSLNVANIQGLCLPSSSKHILMFYLLLFRDNYYVVVKFDYLCVELQETQEKNALEILNYC